MAPIVSRTTRTSKLCMLPLIFGLLTLLGSIRVGRFHEAKGP